MNKLNASILPLVALSVVLSMSALIAVAAHWPDRSGTMIMARATVVHRAAPMQNVRIVMRDPGCHWFQTASGYKRTLNVTGPVNLTNMDEAPLRVSGASGTRVQKVGTAIHLAKGTYRITMVGQQPDDNHLKLNVS